MVAMKKGADALKGIHSSLYVILPALPSLHLAEGYFRKVEKVDQTMDSIREQMDLTNEISDAISNPTGMGNQIDEVRFPAPYSRAVGQRMQELTRRRTSSKPSSRLWSRKSWTTDWQVQIGYLCIRRYRQWGRRRDGNVGHPLHAVTSSR